MKFELSQFSFISIRRFGCSMKISLIGPSYPFRGGISLNTTLLFRALKVKHEVEFYSFSRQYPKWLFPGKDDEEREFSLLKEEKAQRIIDSLNPYTWIKVFFKIRKNQSEVLIIPWWVSFWFPQFLTISILIKIFTKTKILFICHNVIEHESNILKKLCTKAVLSRGDFFIVHSDEDYRNLKKISPESNIKKSFLPVIDYAKWNKVSKEDARKRLGICTNAILFFGIIRPYKGLGYLLKAMPEVLKHIKVTLLVVGEFWYGLESIKENIKELGIEENVRIIDEYIPSEDIGLYFAASDLLVLPYVAATGSSILQISMACKKPVIATRVGSFPDIITDGKTGYLVEPKSSKLLAEKIVEFYKKNKEDEFIMNIETQKKDYSWERAVEIIEEFFSPHLNPLPAGERKG